MEMSHAHFAEVSRVVFVKIGSVMVLNCMRVANIGSISWGLILDHQPKKLVSFGQIEEKCSDNIPYHDHLGACGACQFDRAQQTHVRDCNCKSLGGFC